METYSGRFHDGQSARAQPVRVELSALALEIVGANEIVHARWPLAEVHLTDAGRKGEALRLRRGSEDTARLVIDDPSAAAAFAAACPNLGRARSGFRREWRAVLLWGGSAIGGLAFALFVLLPLTAESLARAVPFETERAFGAALARQVIEALSRERGGAARTLCAAPTGRQALDRLMARITPAEFAGRITLTVVDLPMINALTLPGGQLVLFRGLIDFAQGPEEIAGALAHELGHAAHRHSLELLFENAGTAALIGLLVGDVTGGTAIAGLGQFLLQASYRREAEREADAFAVERLSAAGIDGEPLARMFDRLDARQPTGKGAFSIFMTHPISPERAAAIRATERADGPALTAQEWRDLKRVCER